MVYLVSIYSTRTTRVSVYTKMTGCLQLFHVKQLTDLTHRICDSLRHTTAIAFSSITVPTPHHPPLPVSRETSRTLAATGLCAQHPIRVIHRANPYHFSTPVSRETPALILPDILLCAYFFGTDRVYPVPSYLFHVKLPP
jgi:hypothetical protein